MRDVKLWNRRFHLIGLKRVVGKRTCDGSGGPLPVQLAPAFGGDRQNQDRKSTRLNSSHGYISYAVFCLKKKIINLMTRNIIRFLDEPDLAESYNDLYDRVEVLDTLQKTTHDSIEITEHALCA